jgi:hypothetical protein
LVGLADRRRPLISHLSPDREIPVRTSLVVIGGALAACLAFRALAEEPKRVPLYTNDDLKRVSPRRGETGVLSEPAPAAAVPRAPESESQKRARDEAYWRREAQRLREWAEAQRQSSAELQARIAERSKLRGVLTSRDPQIQSWERRVRAVEARIREREVLLADRARREGALPGWLR